MHTTSPECFAIYSRKSKITGIGESIENQIELCRRYIALHYGTEVAADASVYEDEGFSGGTLERPRFKEMMRDLKEKRFTAVVVYRLDRISRNIGDFAGLIEELNDRGIAFISIREQFDTSSPMGRAMMYIASVFSQLERETIAERIRDNMHELAKTGRWLGGVTPTGFVSESIAYVTLDGKRRRVCRLKAVPEEIRTVKHIYDVFAETGSLTATERYMLADGYQTKQGKPFSRFSVKALLTNPVYMIADEDAYIYWKKKEAALFADRTAFDGVHGIMAYNRTLQRTGKAHKENPIDEWIIAVGEHEGVIDGGTWIRVQTMLAQNRGVHYRKPRSHTALLAGVLRCGKCGSFMRPKMTDRIHSSGDPLYMYICTSKERSGGQMCRTKNVQGNWLDAQVMEAIRCASSPRIDTARQILRARKQIEETKNDIEAERTELAKQIEDNALTLRRLVRSIGGADSGDAEKYLHEQMEALSQNGARLQQRLSALDERLSESALSDAEADAICCRLAIPWCEADAYTTEEKRAAVRTFIRGVYWDGETAQIYFHGAAEENVPLCEDSE